MPHDCRFRPTRCPNVGCGERASVQSLSIHDECCKFKLLSCQKCSEIIRRSEMPAHAAAACPEREACCAFAAIGCPTALTQREVPTHLDECYNSHMLLMLQVVVQQQETIDRLGSRVGQLEGLLLASEEQKEAQESNVRSLEIKMGEVFGRLGGLEQTVKDGAKADRSANLDGAHRKEELAAKIATVAAVVEGQGKTLSELAPLCDRLRVLQAATAHKEAAGSEDNSSNEGAPRSGSVFFPNGYHREPGTRTTTTPTKPATNSLHAHGSGLSWLKAALGGASSKPVKQTPGSEVDDMLKKIKSKAKGSALGSPVASHLQGPYADSAGSYKIHDLVGYFSESHSDWLPATITKVDGEGCVVIDLKPNTHISQEDQSHKVRPRERRAADGAEDGLAHEDETKSSGHSI
ncbi:unnamed protein product [Polarella glacialis]|uniref:TRAF-type domain-containing protein n=1 Tax=Polarella glacialis TaxID=89957 RepID=A0A813KEU0_POLGL|nr:unnamed protein product [Polarella glacialis]